MGAVRTNRGGAGRVDEASRVVRLVLRRQSVSSVFRVARTQTGAENRSEHALGAAPLHVFVRSPRRGARGARADFRFRRRQGHVQGRSRGELRRRRRLRGAHARRFRQLRVSHVLRRFRSACGVRCKPRVVFVLKSIHISLLKSLLKPLRVEVDERLARFIRGRIAKIAFHFV